MRRRSIGAAAGALVAVLGIACTRPPAHFGGAGGAPTSASPAAAVPIPSTFGPLPGDVAAPAFQGTVGPIDPATRRRMGGSWRPGCPVPISNLRLLTMSFWGFDGQAHTGHLIVNRTFAARLVGVFRTLYGARYPIRKMEIVHVYVGPNYAGRSDRPSDDDTAGFNCRSVLGSPGVWSQHAYGLAVDINPVENPYVSSTREVLPKEGKWFADRSRSRPGMIMPNGVVVRAFASIGWAWGGTWHSFQDYMHFSASGK